MNFKKVLVLPMLSLVLSFNVCDAQHYFWADNKINELEADSSILVLKKENQEAGRTFTNIAADKVESYGECVVFRNLTKLHRKNLSSQKIEFATAYRINSVPVIATNVISFRPKAGIDEIELAFRQRIRFRDKTESGVYHYLVNNFRETLSVANAISESGLVEWCQPDFVIEIKPTTVDPLYNQQYYLNNTGQTGGVNNIDINAPEAWAISTGCYITRVAVLDHGVEPHEDLGARYQTGFTALNPAGTGLPASTQYHGQACAGIIAASHDNNLGIAGVSPTSLIIPVNGVIGTNNVSQIADGIDAAWRPNRANADVLSNSWSFANAPSLTEIKEAINNARTLGRNGKGAIVVFSAGNGGGGVEFPANVNGVIAVGAINKSGIRWSGSATGSSLDLVAPTGWTNGDVYSLDLSDDPANPNDNRGNTNGNYLSTFGGTSAAAPQVAGVAALMLAVNPNLTESQVSNILQQSATDMGVVGVDNNYGFGRLNAYEALKLSIGSIEGSSVTCTTSQFTFSAQLQGVTGLTWSSSNPSGLSINSTTGAATRMNNFNGRVNVTASVNGECGVLNVTRDVGVGNYFPTGTSSVNSNCSGSSFNILNTSLSAACTANTPIYFTYRITDPNYSNFVFTPVSVPSGATWSFSGGNLYMTVNTPSSQGSRSAIIALSATGPCGPYNVSFTSTAVNYYSSFFSMSPNPSQENVTVSMDNENLINDGSQNLIYEIKITDLFGTLGKSFEYKAGINSINIPLQDFNPGLYILSVFDGKMWSSKQLIIQK